MQILSAQCQSILGRILKILFSPIYPLTDMAKLNDIQLLRTTFLRGPSVWTYRPVLEVWLDLGELEDFPSNKIPGLNERLTAWLPDLIEHTCGVGERGGFIQRLEGGTWMGHVLEHVIIELLNLAGMPAEFGQTREISKRGVYRMVFRCPEEAVARVALEQGHKLLMAAINDEVRSQACRSRHQDSDQRPLPGPSTGCIVDAATERRIPHIRLNDGNLVQLGYGAAQRRIWTAESDQTSAIAEGIAQDKDFTKRLLACGVPVPEGQIVHSPEEAWEVAQDIGFPVTVKPSDGNHARGVTLELSQEADIKAAFALAEPEGSDVIVEKFIDGVEHRLLVVGGKVVAATRARPFPSTATAGHAARAGRGAEPGPRRGPEQEYPLDWINLEAGAVKLELNRQHVTPDSVIPRVRPCCCSAMAIWPSTAWTTCTPTWPTTPCWLQNRGPRYRRHGHDPQDVSQPMQGQGAILEVNAGPGLLMHLKPTSGAPRPVGMAIADHLFPREDGSGAGRIPIAGIVGTRNNAFIARLVGWLLQLSGKLTGVASSEGMFIANRQTQKTNTGNWAGAHRLLTNRLAQAAVIQTTARSILEEGLAYDRCLVGVVTDMDGYEQLADHDVLEPGQMRRVMRTQIDVVLDEGAGVLNADLPEVADLAELCDGEVILYSMDAANEAVATHRANTEAQHEGGRAVFVKGNNVVLATGAQERVLGTLDALSLPGGKSLIPLRCWPRLPRPGRWTSRPI